MDKVVNCGSKKLLSKNEWTNPQNLTGEGKVLDSPISKKAFERVLELHRPKHDIAFVSLCTKTKPYSKSKKWKAFQKHFGPNCDLIVLSSIGIVPEEFWECYPYMSYDGYSNRTKGNKYARACYTYLYSFFTKHKYKKIILNFSPSQRARTSAKVFKKMMKDISKDIEIVILPTEATYSKLQADGFPEGKMFPDLSKLVLAELQKEISK